LCCCTDNLDGSYSVAVLPTLPSNCTVGVYINDQPLDGWVLSVVAVNPTDDLCGSFEVRSNGNNEVIPPDARDREFPQGSSLVVSVKESKAGSLSASSYNTQLVPVSSKVTSSIAAKLTLNETGPFVLQLAGSSNALNQQCVLLPRLMVVKRSCAANDEWLDNRTYDCKKFPEVAARAAEPTLSVTIVKWKGKVENVATRVEVRLISGDVDETNVSKVFWTATSSAPWLSFDGPASGSVTSASPVATLIVSVNTTGIHPGTPFLPPA
jgi:hypothetical protein